MGCSGSRSQGNDDDVENERLENKETAIVNSKLEKLIRSKQPDDLLIAFLYLEKGISEEEDKSPSSVFGEALSRQQQIKARLQMAMEDKNLNEFFSEDCSIQELFADLGLAKNGKMAVENEEFVARINRRALNENEIKIWQKAFGTVDDLIRKSSQKIKTLQDAYQQQEELLVKIFGKPHVNELEKTLEKELDRMRYYRDMLYIGVLQWEACLEKISLAVRLAKEGVSAWNMAHNQSLEKKLKLTTVARDCIHEAVIHIQSSEELLQDVQFPFCTIRELRGVSQALDYVYTDILIEERYLHASEVYKNLLQRAALLNNWMKEVLNSKIKKDLLEINEKVSILSKQLKNERIKSIKTKFKLQSSLADLEDKHFSKSIETTAATGKNFKTTVDDQQENSRDSAENLNLPISFKSNSETISDLNSEKAADVLNYFQNLMENKKSRMWPSRRIDELQNLTVKQ